MSDRSAIFQKYLIDQIGFKQDAFLNEYLDKLAAHKHAYAHLAAHEALKHRNGQIYYPDDHQYRKYVFRNGYFVPTKLNIIDLLLLERNVKKERKFTSRKAGNQGFSASDISNFTYCPVSFSIARSFQVIKPISAEIGSFLHDQHRLSQFVERRTTEDKVAKAEKDLKSRDILCKNKTSRELFDELSVSCAVFLGSTGQDTTPNYFTSSNGRYHGQPDYIFVNKNTGRYFVVEEKFQWIPKKPDRSMSQDDKDGVNRERKWQGFYDNHRNQLRSYLYGINDYSLEYGYLVYWEYVINEGQPVVEQCRVDRTRTSDAKNRDIIRKIAHQIHYVLRYHGGEFDVDNRSASKCAGCVYSILCGHKTGRFPTFNYPYSLDHMRLVYVPFPVELKQKRDDSDFEE